MARSILLLFLFAMLYEAEAQYGMLDYSPRFMLGSVAKRQTDGSSCLAPGLHTCLEVNSTSCCPNDHYCYNDPTGVTDCCAIGSDCNNQCTFSSEVAVQQTVTVSGNATATFSCSARACTAGSAFLCPSSLGGGCCSYGSTCGAGGGCTSTVDPATVVLPFPMATGCPAGNFSCPAAEGGGSCCDGAKCTALDSTLLCVTTTAAGSSTIAQTAIRTGPTGYIDSNFTLVNTTSSTLSSGAKAGIGVGVALAILLFVTSIILFAMSRRRAQKYHAEGVLALSEGSNGEKNVSPRLKNGTDYFGPTAKAGPFTETVADSGLTPLGSPDSTNRGVPLSPQGPGDIAAPVEIGGSLPIVSPYVSELPEKPEFRFELP